MTTFIEWIKRKCNTLTKWLTYSYITKKIDSLSDYDKFFMYMVTTILSFTCMFLFIVLSAFNIINVIPSMVFFIIFIFAIYKADTIYDE